MRPIRPHVHRTLDFVTVVGFAAAPSLLGLQGLPATLSYVLAFVHLALTLLTRFSPAERGLVPLRAHGLIELLVGVVLVVVPFALGWTGVARTFYVAAGVVILAVWALSEYNEQVVPVSNRQDR